MAYQEPSDEQVIAWMEVSGGVEIHQIIASIARKAAAWGYHQCAMEQLRQASLEMYESGIRASSSGQENGMFRGGWEGGGDDPNERRMLNEADVELLIDRLKDPADARRFLQDAGLIDENGNLAKPCQLL